VERSSNATGSKPAAASLAGVAADEAGAAGDENGLHDALRALCLRRAARIIAAWARSLA